MMTMAWVSCPRPEAQENSVDSRKRSTSDQAVVEVTEDGVVDNLEAEGINIFS